ncbi:MAG: RNA polymerase sporulation sigma factor SigK [Beduini sp.]|uniref:RNA polymerase sporulation sigma factor SigK n=1 Tax=Beduini sp. TaxID=1922300 RepID=UPI0011C87611
MLYYIMLLLQNPLFLGYIKTNIFLSPLSKDDEEKYIEQWVQGDRNARDKLIEHNLRLVAHIAKKYESSNVLQEDLISIGTIGLIKAVDSYSNHHQTKLATYASRCIENEILMFLRYNKKTRLDVSINEAIGKDKDDGEIALIDVIPMVQPEIIDTIHLSDQIKQLLGYLDILSEREREIIELRYGLNLKKALTQKEIAKQYKISRSYVSRIEKRALTKLLKCFIEDEEEKKKGNL